MKRLGERAGCEGLRDCVYVCGREDMCVGVRVRACVRGCRGGGGIE